MTDTTRGRDLFIVDNSVSGWTGLRYLEEWSGIAKAFDIATGYFEIGALLALDGKWQPLDTCHVCSYVYLEEIGCLRRFSAASETESVFRQ